MFQHLIKEIDNCLKAGNTLAAFYIALTLPDLCGKIEYPSIPKSAERYKKWVDEYARGVISSSKEIAIPAFDKAKQKYPRKAVPNESEVLYHIRCLFLHEGNARTTKLGNIDYLSCINEKPNESEIYVHGIGSVCYADDPESAVIHYRLSICGITVLLRDFAKQYYEDNSEKFEDNEDIKFQDSYLFD